MRLIHHWWSQPVDYVWTAAYHRSDPLLKHAKIALGLWCWLYAALCVLATFTPSGAPDGVRRYLVLAFAVAAAGMGVLWFTGPWLSERHSQLFVIFLEVSASAILLLLSDPLVALPCTAALAIPGSYIAAFHGPKMIAGHQALATVVVGVVFVHAVTEPGADSVLACAYLVLLTLVLFSAPMLSNVQLLFLRRDSAAAFFDSLTSLRNRRGLDSAVAALESSVGTMTVIVVDLDNFKAVNDRYGHSHGDIVLQEAAAAIDVEFPAPAVTARTGGEEFAIVTLADPAAAIEQARRLQARFAVQRGAGVTLSIGVAQSDASDPSATFESVATRADHAMYTAKRAGGNQISISGTVPTPPDDASQVDY